MSEAYTDLRPLLFAIAYRMVGSVAEAEDVVQDAFVRYQRALAAREAEIQSPRAYLSAVTTRLAIDHLRSARVRRERYVGAWLPEPLPTGDDAPDASVVVEDADSLSMAFLAVLERLSPLERAVFLLRDVFDYPFAEIARIVGRKEEACRQLAVRARRHVREERPRFEASRAEREALAERFLDAAGDGDLDGLVELLADDVTVVSDNDGVRPAFRRPIVGRDRVVRLLLGLRRRRLRSGATLRRVELNGGPAAVVLAPDGRIMYALVPDAADDGVRTVHAIVNPAKLRHLGPVANLRALQRERAGRRDAGG
jgi:RNA polymerase sigma-70 factor (ECF subfamily)